MRSLVKSELFVVECSIVSAESGHVGLIYPRSNMIQVCISRCCSKGTTCCKTAAGCSTRHSKACGVCARADELMGSYVVADHWIFVLLEYLHDSNSEQVIICTGVNVLEKTSRLQDEAQGHDRGKQDDPDMAESMGESLGWLHFWGLATFCNGKGGGCGTLGHREAVCVFSSGILPPRWESRCLWEKWWVTYLGNF